jgi:hypothetical protein
MVLGWKTKPAEYVSYKRHPSHTHWALDIQSNDCGLPQPRMAENGAWNIDDTVGFQESVLTGIILDSDGDKLGWLSLEG